MSSWDSKPLDATLLDELGAALKKHERWWHKLPGICSFGPWNRLARPIEQQYADQLRNRPESWEARWPDPGNRDIAMKVSEISRREMGWPNDRFIPDDPVRVVFWAHEDGLDDIAAFMELEDQLGVKINDETMRKWFDLTLAEMVEELAQMVVEKTELVR